jgi:murein DD-endopeptidase MepM/ murein hydrolase activator NlpD
MRFLLLGFLFILNFGFGDTLTVDPLQVLQGHSFKVNLTTTQVRPGLKVLFKGRYYPLYAVTANKTQVILGVSYDVPAGSYPVKVMQLTKTGKKLIARAEVKILPANFPKSILIISSKKVKEGVTNFDVLDQESLILGRTFRSTRLAKYWQGKFLPPLKQQVQISSPYGSQRIYKNEKGQIISTWAHRGIDYAAKIGTPVYATNSGLVMVSRPLQVHGSTIVIDHGQGVVSVYNHLSKRLVQKSSWVKKGQLIGYSGNSGLTTGANLHYGLSVNNVRINPLEWFEKAF